MPLEVGYWMWHCTNFTYSVTHHSIVTFVLHSWSLFCTTACILLWNCTYCTFTCKYMCVYVHKELHFFHVNIIWFSILPIVLLFYNLLCFIHHNLNIWIVFVHFLCRVERAPILHYIMTINLNLESFFGYRPSGYKGRHFSCFRTFTR